nr:hypothetical protein [Tanacetum cinerariifolium]
MDIGCRLGTSFTQGMVSSIPIDGSISPEGFLLPILLVVVIIVTVVIVAVILIVVVVIIKDITDTFEMMILESVEQGPLLWPSMEVEGVTRLKKYSELSVAEAIQADYDVKATNIILQGLPPKVYALVSTHKIAKEL